MIKDVTLSYGRSSSSLHIFYLQTREERLTEAFEKYGPIKECRVARTSLISIMIE